MLNAIEEISFNTPVAFKLSIVSTLQNEAKNKLQCSLFLVIICLNLKSNKREVVLQTETV